MKETSGAFFWLFHVVLIQGSLHGPQQVRAHIGVPATVGAALPHPEEQKDKGSPIAAGTDAQGDLSRWVTAPLGPNGVVRAIGTTGRDPGIKTQITASGARTVPDAGQTCSLRNRKAQATNRGIVTIDLAAPRLILGNRTKDAHRTHLATPGRIVEAIARLPVQRTVRPTETLATTLANGQERAPRRPTAQCRLAFRAGVTHDKQALIPAAAGIAHDTASVPGKERGVAKVGRALGAAGNRRTGPTQRPRRWRKCPRRSPGSGSGRDRGSRCALGTSKAWRVLWNPLTFIEWLVGAGSCDKTTPTWEPIQHGP